MNIKMTNRFWLTLLAIGVCWPAFTVGAAEIFSGSTFAFKDPEGTVAGGPNGGVQFMFDGIVDGGSGGTFFNTGFFPPSSDPIPGGNAAGTIRVTARQLDGNDPTSQIFVILGEPNPDFIFEGSPTPRRELHSYRLVTGDFSDSGFTTIDIPISNTFSITSTDLGGGAFAPVGVGDPATQEFDTRGVDFVLFQNEFNNFEGTVNLEVLSIEVVPEPASLSLLAFGAATMLNRRRR